ncbi:hypothetical protein IV203_030204 [Nitzschia inconspicua]|uniref:Uncharacterized protein n=1 Tax=Nitzschia inconspicua TaxID=303405 RepID=A0A9K3LT42_9STRA|nr:hypothetical protein IV203_030204 [Nitzschia inconspicua]
MSDTLLGQYASLLGYSSSFSRNDTTDRKTRSSSAIELKDAVAISVDSISYPSLSLSYSPVEAVSASSTPSPTREDIQMKALTCMAQQILVDVGSLPNEQQNYALEQISRHMLENFLDSFDQLVDARIRQYSKVLSNHSLSLLSASGRADVVEYKLRTLLEIGTNISFGSISIQFDNTASTKSDIKCGTNTSLPVMLVVEIDSLQFRCPSWKGKVKHPHHHHRSKLTFHAPAWIHHDYQLPPGISSTSSSSFNEVASWCSTTTTTPTTTTSGNDFSLRSNNNNFNKNLTIQVDCEVLLKEMIQEAGEVVGMVVELTNQAWTQNQKSIVPCSSSSASKESNASVAALVSVGAPTEGETGPKLRVKTVSEPELAFHPSDGMSEENKIVGFEDEHGPSKRIHSCSNDTNDSGIPPSSSRDRDSDEENANPSMSAEKASHIIDYVFDEIEDVFIPPLPPPRKKPRIEFS